MLFKNQRTKKFYSILNSSLYHLPNNSSLTVEKYGLPYDTDIIFTSIKKHIYITFDESTQGYNERTVTTTEDIDVFEYIDKIPTISAPEKPERTVIAVSSLNFSLASMFRDGFTFGCLADSREPTEVEVGITCSTLPIHLLEGEVEVYSYRTQSSVVNVSSSITGILKPKLVYKKAIEKLDGGYINSVTVTDYSDPKASSSVKFLFTPNNLDWFYYSNDGFVPLPNIERDTIEKYGMTEAEANAIKGSRAKEWKFSTFNIAGFMDDYNGVKSKLGNISYEKNTPLYTSSLSNASLYILNTTARIDIALENMKLSGVLSDADTTRVQYRVKLNGQTFFPENGEFTSLSTPPKSISLTIPSDRVQIGDSNTLEVEFQDFFGATDSWSTSFIGKYIGLMFTDKSGKYYSTNVGEVIKYLDFGQLLGGQVSPVYSVVLRNSFDQALKEVKLTADTSTFAEGLVFEFSKSDTDFSGENSLTYESLPVNGEVTFFTRMRSEQSTAPNGNSTFDIYTSAKFEE